MLGERFCIMSCWSKDGINNKDCRREPDQLTWKKCYQLYFQAFREPKSTADRKKLARILKKPLDPDIETYFFSYDAFLRGLGRMSLSMFLSRFF
jgi:hypothetical protein